MQQSGGPALDTRRGSGDETRQDTVHSMVCEQVLLIDDHACIATLSHTCITTEKYLRTTIQVNAVNSISLYKY